MKKHALFLFLSIVFVAASAFAQYAKYFHPKGTQLPGPETSADFSNWLTDMKHWRRERLISIGYDDSQYLRPELAWTQSAFVQPLMMIHERYFYDPVAGKYTVDRYLDDLERRYGGIDSVVIWHSYPDLGIDNRNQYDLLRDMPGGVAGVRQMIADFHRRGVRVVFPMMVWDQGTRDEGVPNWTASARLLAAVGADGVYGDTLGEVPLAARKASDATGHPLVLEPESMNTDLTLPWDTFAWEYWDYSSFAPMVSIYKWLESRHMENVSRRWARDKTDDLQYAFFNGVGYSSWENVWGTYNDITPRDAEALRRIATIERGMAPLMVSPDWEPHVPTLQFGIYSSKFPGQGRTLWTLVNRNEYDLRGRQIEVPFAPGTRFYDLWRGVELKPEVRGSTATLSFEIEGHGYGALFAIAGKPDQHMSTLIARMNEISAKPLREYSHEWKFLPQEMLSIAPTKPAATAPAGMVRIPGATYEFRVSGNEIEGFNDAGVDVQYPWEDSPRRHHVKVLTIKPFYVDKFPVTNADFKKFVGATHYHPKDDHNFLRDWKDGTYPEGWANKPVTWVALEDARAYAAWAGKRLPHDWEWQYAARGTDGRLYPWGNQVNAGAVPPPETHRVIRPPTDVDAFPQGASPFGVLDLTGNVWQWTDEFTDAHTRTAIVRGGSYFQPQGEHWYFPQPHNLNEHNKYLLIGPSTDRAGTLGFRCVVDAE